jgi:hypothetical protein
VMTRKSASAGWRRTGATICSVPLKAASMPYLCKLGRYFMLCTSTLTITCARSSTKGLCEKRII